MLYFATALYEEAAPLISHYALKQDTSLLPFEIFKNEQVLLIVTKPGALRAAIALSHLFTLFPPGRGDFFLSLGTAACADQRIAAGSPFLIHKLTDAATTRTMYPELLFTCPFSEAALITVPAVLTKAPAPLPESTGQAADTSALFSAPLLYDMEGSAIYETAATYFDTHQFALIRVVSDHMTELSSLTGIELRTLIRSLIEEHTPVLCSWLEALTPFLSDASLPDCAEQALFTKISEWLCCSVSMQNSLKQLMSYLRQNIPDYPAAFQAYLDTIQPLPCSCRKEGKATLEQLRDHFL